MHKEKQSAAMSNLSKLAAVAGGLVLLIALGVIGYVVAPYFVGESAASRTEFLDKVSAQINTDLPTKVDDSTRLDNTTVDGETLQFNYTLLPPLADTLDAETFMSRYEAGIQETICARGRLRRMLQKEFQIAYRYKRDDGTALGDIEVTRADCGI